MSTAGKISRYFHTVRHLRPIQISARLWSQLYQPRPDVRSAPPQRVRHSGWHEWSWRLPLMLGPSTFNFLNATGDLDVPADWDDPSQAKLWRYNLHYFDDLVARDPAAREDWHRILFARWIAENPAGAGTGWEPYPTSLRIVNWIKWALARPRPEVAFDSRTLDSLATQARWLRKKLEFHILANHIWANGKALAFAGVYFEGPEADQWRRKGFAILAREMDEQILPDGGHFERSTMYHGIILEDVLDLINLSGAFPGVFPTALVNRLHDTCTRMLHWLRVMTHPDGKLSFFNDAAFGITAEHAQLAAYARALGVCLRETPLPDVEALADSGYVRLQNRRAVAICDVAPIGPDYLPGHAHADTLSFELSVDGDRVLVNSGTSTYEAGVERARQRGTAAHNSVVVDEQDSSEVWASFRVARRARPVDSSWGSDDGSAWLRASHDGYRRLPGRVLHQRSWVMHANGLSVTDGLAGRFTSAYAVFRLHPAFDARWNRQSVILSRHGRAGATLGLECEPPALPRQEVSSWHPEFGRSVECVELIVPFSGDTLVTNLSW